MRAVAGSGSGSGERLPELESSRAHREILSHNLFRSVAKKLFRSVIEHFYGSSFVDHNHGINERFKDVAIECVVVFLRVCRSRLAATEDAPELEP